MTEDEFKEPLQYLEGALGESPKTILVEWLWEYYGKSGGLEPKTWARACRMVAHGKTPARYLVGNHFIQAITDARNEAHDKKKKKDKAHFLRRETGKPRPMLELMKEAFAELPTPWLKRRIEEMERGKGNAGKES